MDGKKGEMNILREINTKEAINASKFTHGRKQVNTNLFSIPINHNLSCSFFHSQVSTQPISPT